MRTASPGSSAASAAGVGHRSNHASYAGTTRATGVCWSITSLTSTAHADVPGRRHGRARAAPASHAVTASASVDPGIRGIVARGPYAGRDGNAAGWSAARVDLLA